MTRHHGPRVHISARQKEDLLGPWSCAHLATTMGGEQEVPHDQVLTGTSTGRRGWGRARRNPTDPEMPSVGEEIAAARALADLSHHLAGPGCPPDRVLGKASDPAHPLIAADRGPRRLERPRPGPRCGPTRCRRWTRRARPGPLPGPSTPSRAGHHRGGCPGWPMARCPRPIDRSPQSRTILERRAPPPRARGRRRSEQGRAPARRRSSSPRTGTTNRGRWRARRGGGPPRQRPTGAPDPMPRNRRRRRRRGPADHDSPRRGPPRPDRPRGEPGGERCSPARTRPRRGGCSCRRPGDRRSTRGP